MVQIDRFTPCKEAVIFRSKYSSFEEAWKNCHRGDWMLWLAYRLNIDEKLLFRAKALCAKTVIHLMKDGRSKAAIQGALDYSEGKISKDELKIIAASASVASASASVSAAASVADASVAFAAAAAAAAAAASFADTAASAAADAVDYREKNQKLTANICREVLTESVFEKKSIIKCLPNYLFPGILLLF